MAESRSTATGAKRAAGAVTFILASLASTLPAVAGEDCAAHPVEIATVEELSELLNPTKVPEFEGCARTGIGVFETLKSVAKLVLTELKKGGP